MIKLLSLVLIAGFVLAHAEDPDRGVVNTKGCSHQDLTRCWTSWFDIDDECRSGDYETINNIITRYPGKMCSDPVDIEARTLSGLTPDEAGDDIYGNDASIGFICRNGDQNDGNCSDYRVRFSCYPPYCAEMCWTEWFNSDDNSGTGDWELLIDLDPENPGKICKTPLFIEAVTIDTLTSAASTGEIFSVYSPTGGFHCDNDKQVDGQCRDYKVRFGCPCVFGYKESITDPDLDTDHQVA